MTRLSDRWAIALDRLGRAFGLVSLIFMLTTIFSALKEPATATKGPPTGLVAAMVCMYASFALESFAGRLQQRRNRISAAMDGRGYFLYLRSLRARELQTVTHSAGAANPLPNAFIVDDVPAELAEALVDIGTLFVIGSKDTGSMAWSPNTILLRSHENTWRPLFHRLARGSRGIFLIPGETSGIIEELKELTEQRLFHKVIVLMAPATGRDRRHRNWNSLAAALAQYGYHLPDFVDGGMVYSAFEDLAPCRTAPYLVDGRRSLGAALGLLIRELPTNESIAEAIYDIATIERGARLNQTKHPG